MGVDVESQLICVKMERNLSCLGRSGNRGERRAGPAGGTAQAQAEGEDQRSRAAEGGWGTILIKAYR